MKRILWVIVVRAAGSINKQMICIEIKRTVDINAQNASQIHITVGTFPTLGPKICVLLMNQAEASFFSKGHRGGQQQHANQNNCKQFLAFSISPY